MRWTLKDESAAFGQGWGVSGGYRSLIRREHCLPDFKTDEEAIDFVKAQAQQGNKVAQKALKLHEAALVLPPPPEPAPAPLLVSKIDI